ncbi:ComEC/Rec2 family competence protein [Sphingomonas sp. LY29]|uniref:ComEC/Rec2 family competence protein n=1 Tax=Sphingomonas sp. LY29 TaxID=3095341 RepID=UPI002D784566|nr:ComEC/Rec2 family competence protein [Sphingomonas sp. LY29]WRP25934.1 ComEC/Rec2 family competence protein [Sphingomonas sp. LY29]
MDWVSAPNIEDAGAEQAEEGVRGRGFRLLARIETFLELERAQLPLWFAVAFGSGIAAWLWLPGPSQWAAFLAFAAAVAAAGLTGRGSRLGRSALVAGLAMMAGCALIWWRATDVAAPRLDRPQVVNFTASVERVETRAAKGDLRLTLAPQGSTLPPRVRVSLPIEDAPRGVSAGAVLELRARLQPPPPMALPGGHDFARDAWFQGIGGVGRALGKPRLVEAGRSHSLDSFRERLGTHIQTQLPGASGGIATALATGDQAAIGEEDAEAMRRSGLAHLLSVSGLHIAAVVGAAMLLSLRLLALSERLALRVNLVLVSAGFGAIAGIGYTLLTGMQVPTVRACIAAVLVLAGIALGRDAISLRLFAVGAIIVMLLRPEAIAGASFQLSFAAVTSIIALHHWTPVRTAL